MANYEQSVVMLKDPNYVRYKTYRDQLDKQFRRCMPQGLESSKPVDEVDPKFACLKSSRDVQCMCVISKYNKKKNFTKTKSIGAKYENGAFETRVGGCMTSKTPKYDVALDVPYFVEEKSDPKIAEVAWDTNNEFRLIVVESKEGNYLGIYSSEEYDLTRILYNLEHLKIANRYSGPDSQKQVLTLKYTLPARLKSNMAEIVIDRILNHKQQSKDFMKDNKNYDSQINDDEKMFTRVDTAKSNAQMQMDHLLTSSMDSSNFDMDSHTHLGSQVDPYQARTHDTALNPASKIKSDFAKKTNEKVSKKDGMPLKSILKHPDQGGMNVQESTVIQEIISRPKITSSQVNKDGNFGGNSDFKFGSMIQGQGPIQARTFGGGSVMGGRGASPNPGRTATEESTVIGIHHQNRGSIGSQNKTGVTPKTGQSRVGFSTIDKSGVTSGNNLSPNKVTSKYTDVTESGFGQPQLGSKKSSIKKNLNYFKQGEKDNLYNTQIADDEVNSAYKSTYKKNEYFNNDGIDLSKASQLGDQRLVDMNHNFSNQRGDKNNHDESVMSSSFTLASVMFPLSIDSATVTIEVFAFGVGMSSSSHNPDQPMVIKKQLIKTIQMDKFAKGYVAESNTNVVQLNERVNMIGSLSDFIEMAAVHTASNSVLGTVMISHDLFNQLQACEGAFSVPLQVSTDYLLINLLPETIQNNREKKIKMVSTFTNNFVQNLKANPMLPQDLDHIVNVNFRNRKLDDVFLKPSTFKLYLPTNFYLCLWLLITKKFKPKDTSKKVEDQDDQVVRFKSSIMQSLYVSKQEVTSLETNNRVSLHFHKLMRNLEKQAELSNSTHHLVYGTIIEQVKGEYFKSSINRLKILDYMFSKIMSDYFNMLNDDGQGSKNVLFSRNFRSCSRDYMIIQGFINLYCENLVKISHLTARDIVLWIIDHILSVNIGILREPAGYYHLNLLFMMSVKYKDDPSNDYGWRINLYLHVFILQQLEKLLEGRLNCYLDIPYSLEYLYGLITSKAGFYESFIQAYQTFEKHQETKGQKPAGVGAAATGAIENFIKNINGSGDTQNALILAEDLYTKFNSNADLRRVFEENVLENILVYQISRLSLKPHKLINLVKVDKTESLRKVVIKIHNIYNRDHIDDKNYFTLLLDGKEHEQDDTGKFYITLTGVYTPAIDLRLHKIGDDLLYKNNNTMIGSTTLQLRRYKSNVVHRMLLSVTHSSNGKEYYCSASLLVLEAVKAKEELKFNEDNVHFKHMGALGFLFMDNFKHTISNFEDLIIKKLTFMYDDLAMEIQDQFINSKFFSVMVSGYQIQANLKEAGAEKSVKISDKQLQYHSDSFLISLKILLFRKNFDMLEDYIMRYFGSDVNSITAAETIYSIQSLLKIIDIRVHLLEIVAYVERIIKKPISPKLEACSLLLNVQADRPLASIAEGAKHVDLKSVIGELISYMSFKKNNCSVVFGDNKDLFLIKDIVEKMRLNRHLGESNFLSIRYVVGGTTITETVCFNKQFKTKEHIEMEPGHIDMDDLLKAQRYTIDISPLDTVRISKNELRSLLTQVPLIDYLRFVTQAINN